MNSNLRKKLFTGAMVLLVTVFFIPAFAGAFTPGNHKADRGFGMKKHHSVAFGNLAEPENGSGTGAHRRTGQGTPGSGFCPS